MIHPKNLFDELKKNGINFYTGVPDSLLKNFCSYIEDNLEKNEHIIAANEGGAIGIASGYNLATGKVACVYMQNSGLGNSVNPILSLADSEVYQIPILLIIGWRAEPGVKDEPQHIKQGKVMIDMLNAMKIPWKILSDNVENLEKEIQDIIQNIKSSKSPYALIVKKGTFEKYKLEKKTNNNYELSREEALQIVLSELNKKDIIVSTTGKLSRELYEYRENNQDSHNTDFLTVGSMGHSSQIALGIALNKSNRTVYCFDGDGACIMHLGAFAIIGEKKPKNFRHIIFNNGAHESVGGQPTAGFNIKFTELAKSSGYNEAFLAINKKELLEKLPLFKKSIGPSILEIRINLKSREDLGRPKESPKENKEIFMRNLNEGADI